MRLLWLLRSDGPMTATQAAARLDDNVPSCSFHLRQLAKYGFAERVAGVADPATRPPGSRPVQIIQTVVPRGAVLPEDRRAASDDGR